MNGEANPSPFLFVALEKHLAALGREHAVLVVPDALPTRVHD